VRRYACYIDVGYLYAEGARLLSGMRQPRHAVHLDYDGFLCALADLARTRVPGGHLLRVYWYDGARGAPTPAQMAIAYRDDLKLRLGMIDAQGNQRGVDALLVRDLVLDAHHRNISDALVLTGDDDLRGGLLAAQEMGVRVQLIGVGEVNSGNQARALLMEADGVALWDQSAVARWMSIRPSIGENEPDDDDDDVHAEDAHPAAAASDGPGTGFGGEREATPPHEGDPSPGPLIERLPPGSDLNQATRNLALEFSTTLDLEELEEIIESWSVARQGIPPRYDKPLMWRFGQLWPDGVGPAEKRVLRLAFVEACRGRMV
jgi:hypothetical protein